MRKLHLVGFTSDRKGLIFSVRRGSKSGSFVVAFEDSFVDTLAAEQRRRDAGEDLQPEPEAVPESRGGVGDDIRASIDRRRRPESTLTPREMQARLRAGRTIAEVAREARVDPEWVERFAVPILAEQAQMVELARNLTYGKPRRGPSAEPLGPSVSENLIDRGVVLMDDVFDAAWTANQLHDVVWVVRLRYRSRGRDQEALWEVNVATGQLTARNRLASALGYVDERQRRARPGAPESDTPEPEPVRRTAKAPATRRSGRAKAVAKKSAPAARGRKRVAKAMSTRPSTARSARPATKAASAAKAKNAPTTRARSTRPASKSGTRTAATRGKKAPAPARKAPASKRTAPPARGARTSARKAPTAARKAPTAAKAPGAGAARRAPTATPPATPRAMKTRQAVAAAKPRVRVGTDGSPGASGAPAANGSPAGRGRSPDATAAALATEPPRVPINRLATNRMAASRAAAGRLSGDRRVANPVPPSADEGIGALRGARPRPAEKHPAPPPSQPARAPTQPVPPSPTPAR
ncbi:MAG: septation protein SepH, partial [Acidimicrobiales bacterium]